jgi:hypothetical protein
MPSTATATSPDERPQLSATFTELTPFASSLFAGKKIFVDGTIKGVPDIKTWRAQRRTLATLDELFAYVAAGQRRNCCIIRGLAERQPGGVVLRRKVKKEDDPNDRGFRDVPQPWAAFDFDDITLAPGEDWADDPEGAVDSFVSTVFGSDVSYVAAFTGTHGLLRTSKTIWSGAYDFTKLRIRVFLMLDRAIGCAELKAWSRMVGADEAVARVIQPIYLARPQWLKRPGHDILEAIIGTHTCWLARREYDVAHVPDDLKTEARWQKAEGGGVGLGAVHPDVDTAILAIGDKIYPHLQGAVRLLLQQYPLPDGTDLQAHACAINDTLTARIDALADQVRANLASHKRRWDDLLERLQTDTWRWALWLLEHPTVIFAGERKPTARITIEAKPAPRAAEDALAKWRGRIVADIRFAFVAQIEHYQQHGKGTGAAPPVCVVRGPTGTGKSTAVRAAAVHLIDSGRCNVAIALPRHELGEEQLQAFSAEFPDRQVPAAIWRGYGAADPLEPGARMCRRFEEITAVLRAKVKASALCKQGKGATAMYCPFFFQCGYQRQKQQEARIWFVAHESLVHEKPKVLGEVSAIFIDESFIDAFLFGIDRPIEFAVDLLDTPLPRQYWNLASGRDALRQVLDQMPDGPVSRSMLARVFDRARCDELYRLEWRRKKVADIHPTMPAARLEEELQKVAAHNEEVENLAMLWRTIGEIIDGPHKLSGRLKLHTSAKGRRVLQRQGIRNLPESWGKTPVLITDSTAEIELIRAIWPQAMEKSYTDPLPMLHTRIEQVANRTFSKTNCAPPDEHADPGEDNGEQARTARRLYALAVAEALHFGGKPVGLITHKATEAWIRTNCRVPPWLRLAHFGEVTGRNDFKDVACLIVAGRSLPPAESVTRIAEGLFGEAIAQHDYVSVASPILTHPDQQGRNAVNRDQWHHPDARAEAVRRMACEGGLLQAIGRARAAQRTPDTPLVIKIWTDVGLGDWLGPVKTLLWTPPTLDEVMLAAHGLTLENTTHAATLAPDIVTSAHALRQARSDITRGSSERSVRFPYKNYYALGESDTPRTCEINPPHLDYVRYQLPGVGRKSYAALFLTGVGYISSAWLTEQFGELALFERPGSTDEWEITASSSAVRKGGR